MVDGFSKKDSTMGLLDSACGREATLAENFDYSDYEIDPLTPEEGQILSTAIDMAARQHAENEFRQKSLTENIL